MSSISAGTSAGTALVSTGNTDGTLQLQVNGTTPSITLAANGSIGVGSTPGYGTSGQVLTSAGTGSAPTWATVSAGFTLGTPVATTSGTSIDFTGIPAGTKQIIISFNTVSTNGTSNLLIQLGDSGGIETTSYSSISAVFGTAYVGTLISSTGFRIRCGFANDRISGNVTLVLENSTTFTWSASGIVGDTLGNSEQMFPLCGIKALSAQLDRVRITTVNGTDTFDFGEINIAYI